MFQTGNSLLDQTLQSLPSNYDGPGGVVAVVKDGQAIVRHAWGFADLARRVPMTAETLMPICSISKEFTCAALLEAVGDPARLEDALAAYLPHFEGTMPTVADLCSNRSGLRDYWALTVLCGAAPEGEFRPEDAKSLLGRARTTHFAPGTHYSYANGNFRILSDLIEDHTGRPLGEVVAERVFKPANMKTAQFCTETSAFPGEGIGYEGNPAFGFIPGVNRIHWSGDAGVCASLADMIAWEHFIDSTRDDADGIYRRLSVRQSFSDGAPASYGFGLAHMEIAGVKMTGHGGAIRGWRSQRIHAASERLSVVVMFNHEADAQGAAEQVMTAALGGAPRKRQRQPVAASWFGHYLNDETMLSLSLSPAHGDRLKARFATNSDIMTQEEEGVAQSKLMTLRRDRDGIRMQRSGENLLTDFRPIGGEAKRDIEGRFHCAELDADFVCVSAGGVLHGAFDGFLGKGAMQPVHPIGADVWLLPCQRAMDSSAPGNWTLVFARDEKGDITGVTIGCWLARKLVFEKYSQASRS